MSVFPGHSLRIKFAGRAAHYINNYTPNVIFMANAERVGVSTNTATGVGGGLVIDAATRCQLQRPAVLYRSVNQLVVEIRRDVTAKHRVPLGSSGSRIGSTQRLNDGRRQRRIERRRTALHHQDVVAVHAEVVAMLLMQQAELAVRC